MERLARIAVVVAVIVFALGSRASQSSAVDIKAKATGLPLESYLGSVGVRVTMDSIRACAKFFASEALDRPGRSVAMRSVEFLGDCDDLTLGAGAQ